eukprot:8928912-Pyramimonas_sp.AAC.1
MGQRRRLAHEHQRGHLVRDARVPGGPLFQGPQRRLGREGDRCARVQGARPAQLEGPGASQDGPEGLQAASSRTQPSPASLDRT